MVFTSFTWKKIIQYILITLFLSQNSSQILPNSLPMQLHSLSFSISLFREKKNRQTVNRTKIIPTRDIHTQTPQKSETIVYEGTSKTKKRKKRKEIYKKSYNNVNLIAKIWFYMVHYSNVWIDHVIFDHDWFELYESSENKSSHRR